MPKSRTGSIEAIRVINVARRSAADEWIAIINQMRHIVFCAPDEIRARFNDLSPIRLARTCAGLKPRRSSGDIVRFTTLSTLRELGRRALFVRDQKRNLDTEMRPLIRAFVPALIEGHGVDPDIEAEIDPKALLEGRDTQLEKAIEVILERLATEPGPLPTRPEAPDKSGN